VPGGDRGLEPGGGILRDPLPLCWAAGLWDPEKLAGSDPEILAGTDPLAVHTGLQ